MLENGGENDKFFTANYRGKDIVGRLDWHMDLHYTARPNHGALLRAVVVAKEDGLTGFGDLAKSYQPGPYSPRKPSDVNYPDFADAVDP